MHQPKRKVLFFTMELSGYFNACLSFCIQQNELLDITVIHWPLNPQAPFHPPVDIPRLHFVPKENWLSTDRKVQMGAAELVVVSGWADPEYAVWLKEFPKLNAVVMFDTQWRSNLKFFIGTAWLRFTSMRRFSGAWVPGIRQRKLANRLGFLPHQIREGVYVAEEELFSNEEKSQPWTEMRILFVNRYVKEKDFPQVLVALNEYMCKYNKPWHITAAGTGPERQHCPANKSIEHVGFVQPKDLPALMQHHDVMVLASRYEPWAVSLHEGALSGMVLLASQHVGAADALIDEGKNGFVFQAGDYTDLTSKLDNLDRWSPEQKRNAKEHSKRKAQALSSLYWYESLLYWLNGCAE